MLRSKLRFNVRNIFYYVERKGRKYEKMVDNLLSSLRTNKINRIDVNFVLHEKTLDNIIGRTAHIQFLESNSFIKMLVNCTEGIFE